MARTDSGFGAGLEHGSPDSADDRSDPTNLSNNKKPDGEANRQSSSRSPKQSTSSPQSPRKHSVSSTGRSKPRSSKSRSSSIHSGRTRREEHRPRRIHSSSSVQRVHSNVEEAIAFHERSCRLIASLSISSGTTGQASPPVERLRTPPYLATPALINPRAQSIPTAYDPRTVEPESSVEDLKVERPPAMHWTSSTTRRKEYAKIDKNNKGFRKFLRKVMPCLLSKPSRVDFYDEKDGSDTGSVRRYRLDLPDDDKEKGL